MYITYYTQTKQKDGNGNPLNYIIIFCLSPSPSPPTTFNQFIIPKTLTTSNLEAVGNHRNDCEAIGKTANTSDPSRMNVHSSSVYGTITIDVQGDQKDPNRQNK